MTTPLHRLKMVTEPLKGLRKNRQARPPQLTPRSLLWSPDANGEMIFISFSDLAGASFCGIIVTGFAVIVGIETGLLTAALLILFVTSVRRRRRTFTQASEP